MKLELLRSYHKEGTNGELLFDGKKICNTIELPWQGNTRRISCIPEGTYRLRKRFSPKYKWHLELLSVKDRDYILFHAANDAKKELQGCIAPVTKITGEGRGESSRAALTKLTNKIFPFLEKGFVIMLTVKKQIP